MLGLDATGHPAQVPRRPERTDHADQGGRQHQARERHQQQPAGDQHPAGARHHDIVAQSDQGPRQPAECQSTPESRVPESARDVFQCLPQFDSQVHVVRASTRDERGRGEPARQPGFDNQDADRRQNQPAPELLAIFQLCAIHLPKLLLVDIFGDMARQPAAELLQRFHMQGGRLALHRIEVHGERPRSRPACRP